MTYVKVTMPKEPAGVDGNGVPVPVEISVQNDGDTIPVTIKKHKDEEDQYLPEMLFGNLLTGDNYDDSKKRTTGGRNGYGAKLANIFSTEFTVETASSGSGSPPCEPSAAARSGKASSAVQVVYGWRYAP